MPRVSNTRDRRAQILRAAVFVFGERGFSQATISEIAQRAGIAHGTIYLYFRSKFEIFEALLGWFTERLMSALGNPDAEGSEPLQNDLFHLFERALASCAQYPRLSAVCLKEAHAASLGATPSIRRAEDFLEERIASRIRSAVNHGEISDVSPEFAAHLVLSLVSFAIDRLLTDENYDQIDVLAKQMTSFAMFGLTGSVIDPTASASLVQSDLQSVTLLGA